MVFEDKYGFSLEVNSDLVICKFLNSDNMIEMNKCAQILKKLRDHFVICCIRNTVFPYNLITVSECQIFLAFDHLIAIQEFHFSEFKYRQSLKRY